MNLKSYQCNIGIYFETDNANKILKTNLFCLIKNQNKNIIGEANNEYHFNFN